MWAVVTEVYVGLVIKNALEAIDNIAFTDIHDSSTLVEETAHVFPE